jgi:hypothetical protein
MIQRVASASAFKIKRSERVFFVGKTGSGKTSLAKALLYQQHHLAILDPKHTFTLPSFWKHSIYKDMNGVQNHVDESTIIYRPSLDDMEKGCDPFFFWAFDRHNTLVYVDEAIRVTRGSRIFPGYQTVLQLGRERNVGCWTSTQRPRSVPLAIMTEAEHYFIFRLTSREDRTRIHDWLGYDEVMEPVRDSHGFFYYNDNTGKMTYYSRANLGVMAEG